MFNLQVTGPLHHPPFFAADIEHQLNETNPNLHITLFDGLYIRPGKREHCR